MTRLVLDNMPTIIDLGQKVKIKYPGVYDDLSDDELGRKVKLKYPGAYNDFTDIQPRQEVSDSLIKESAINRGTSILETIKASATGKLNPAQTGINVVGQGVGFGFDVLGTLISKGIQAIPEQIKKPVASVINNLASKMSNNPTIYKGLTAINEGVDRYNAWKLKNPENAKTVEGLVNVAMLAPVGSGTKTGLAGVGKEAGVVGRTLEKSGLEAANIEKQSFVRELVSPIRTKVVKEAQVARTTEAGTGIFKRSVIAPTTQELKAENAVLKVADVSPTKTFQQNYNIISEANVNAAKQLEKAIAENNFIISKKEVISKLNTVKETLKDSPTIVGDAQKTADRLLAGAIKIVNENEGTGLGVLKARKAYDSWVLDQKPKVFDAVSDNAFTIANREVRNILNDILDKKATNVGVKDQLSYQASLFNALDVIRSKAAQEADTAFGRLLQRTGEILGTKNKIVQGLAATVGIGGLGAAATFAPAAAVIGGIALLVYKGGKLVLNPQIRIWLGRILQEIEKALPKATPAKKLDLNNLKKQIRAIIDNEEGFARLPGSTEVSSGEITNHIAQIEKLMRNTENKSTLARLDRARAEAIKTRVNLLKGEGVIPKTI